jgi:hypothetical protein
MPGSGFSIDVVRCAVVLTACWGTMPSGSVVAAEPAPSGVGATAPATLSADPPFLRLTGPDARWTVLVDRTLADGRRGDVSTDARFVSSDPSVCSVSDHGEVAAVGDGQATIAVTGPHGEARVPVTVEGFGHQRPINFANDIVPILSRHGCNSSGCHGKAEGQNGFRLSVFGSDPDADLSSLVRESRGRRVFPAAPDQSLLLLKASGAVPHGGGARIPVGSREYASLRAWIATGLPVGDPDDPHVIEVSIAPRERRLDPKARQRLRVVARFDDGRDVDVTSLARFSSNDDLIATVDESGLVTVGQRPGQVAIMASFSGHVDTFTALVPRPPTGLPIPADAVVHPIDQIVLERLQSLNVVPSEQCDDATFLRRVTLYTIGRLPTVEEARAFLASDRSDRRARWIDALLEAPEFNDYWALVWSDLLRVDRAALGHKAAHDYYQWIRCSLIARKPLDVMAAELITAEGPLAEVPQGAFFKALPKAGEAASAVAQVFLGVRIACAECHHHPSDRWDQDDYYGMTACFAQVGRKTSTGGEAIVAQGEPKTLHPRTGREVRPHALGEPEPTEVAVADRRLKLAEWLTSADNQWFARNLANRVWARYLGRGVVDPVDDVRATNPPSNPLLLDALAADLVRQRFDLRGLIRTIANTATYQRSCEPNATNADDEQNFSRALMRPLGAEVLLDAVSDATEVPEKFAAQPAGTRAVQLWDSRISHHFLKLFGRPQRTTACACERTTEPSVGQVLHMLNAPALQAKLANDAGRVHRLANGPADDALVVDELYLAFLSRHPTPAESARLAGLLHAAGEERSRVAEDVGWSLLNSLEFVLNH